MPTVNLLGILGIALPFPTFLSAFEGHGYTIPMPKRLNRYEAGMGKFLAALRGGNTVTQAATASGIPRRTLYDLRDRDAEFAEAWEDAQEAAVDVLESEVRKRALDPDYKWSHLMLMFMLKRFRPEYKENYKTEQKLTVEHVQEFDFSKKEMEEAISILQQASTGEPPESAS